jgi:hypothetical protein
LSCNLLLLLSRISGTSSCLWSTMDNLFYILWSPIVYQILLTIDHVNVLILIFLSIIYNSLSIHVIFVFDVMLMWDFKFVLVYDIYFWKVLLHNFSWELCFVWSARILHIVEARQFSHGSQHRARPWSYHATGVEVHGFYILLPLCPAIAPVPAD